MNWIEKHRASELPDDWESLIGDNLYLKRDFLSFVERTEKAYKPTYYMLYDGEKADSCFVAFQQKKYNLAMFAKFNFRITVTMIYLPMSVTRSGIVLGKNQRAVAEKIKSIKGYKMTLNLYEDDMAYFFDFATGLTCPKCILSLPFKSFEEYVSSLRSDYRNRAKKVLKKSSSLQIRFIDNTKEFTDKHYRMYRNVQGKSRVRIETLSKEYFMGEQFKVFVAEKDGEAVGFVQLLENGEELIFEFVGVDYDYNEQYSVYHRMLFEIIRYGIENGFKTIDFGQTADDIKLKLGSEYTYLYAALHHSAKPINWFCKKLAKHIEYRPVTTKYRVFKEE